MSDTHTSAAEYVSILDVRQTEQAIRFIKTRFQNMLSEALNLSRVSAPLFVPSFTGINDDLNGVEKPIRFPLESVDGEAEIVQSLAKWKRMALARYGFSTGEGLYTDMNAIRPDESPDELHSFYVDQWDWEKIISPAERNLTFLREIVRSIYGAIKRTAAEVRDLFGKLPDPALPEEITFVHSEELLERYPYDPPATRESKFCRECGAAFVIGVGSLLNNGEPHDGRAPDYDDWTTETGNGFRGLNGDIIVWHRPLGRALELSSMGIRVDRETLLTQLKIRGVEERASLSWHRQLLAGEFPQTIGGGIGQSRLCMFLLQKAHIGEVQASVWPEHILQGAVDSGIDLL